MKYPKTKEVLNQLVADLSQLSMIIHQTHWYMRGVNFLGLHPLMDTWMDEINAQLDEVSERLITLDGAPYSTLKEMAEHTNIPDQVGSFELPMAERFEILSKAYRYLADVYAQGIAVTDEEDDFCTQDMFIEFKTATEKRIWMIQAELGQAPKIDQ